MEKGLTRAQAWMAAVIITAVFVVLALWFGASTGTLGFSGPRDGSADLVAASSTSASVTDSQTTQGSDHVVFNDDDAGESDD